MTKEETQTIKLAQGGDRAALEKLYRDNFDSLYRFVRHKVDTDIRTEDIVAESFTKAFENLQKFKGKSTFKSWIYTIAKNMVIDWYKSKGQEVALNHEITGQDADHKEDEVQAEKEHSYDDNEVLVKSILSELKDNYRQVLELRFLNKLTIRETAEVMQITQNNVKVMQNRAIKKAQLTATNLKIN